MCTLYSSGSHLMNVPATYLYTCYSTYMVYLSKPLMPKPVLRSRSVFGRLRQAPGSGSGSSSGVKKWHLLFFLNCLILLKSLKFDMGEAAAVHIWSQSRLKKGRLCNTVPKQVQYWVAVFWQLSNRLTNRNAPRHISAGHCHVLRAVMNKTILYSVTVL